MGLLFKGHKLSQILHVEFCRTGIVLGEFEQNGHVVAMYALGGVCLEL